MKEPIWLTIETLHLLHDRQVERFGGLLGVRDEGAIESALARPLNAWSYGEATDLAALAATYLVALAQQQGFLDGNKRTALGGTLVFLSLNGVELDVPGEELYALVMAVSTNRMGAEQVAAWLREHL